ncbi:glycoside hydrolase family 97 N-terminal domain-containing protein [Sphingobacterium sp. E70]|uniref:glycoside hydrolase family 97 N-terminal domain-containing protein n=1 Tax=Sphingobacterium sp. E70 TaxID=2853439 RepID=UPI00211D0881|nr:glycoside hydrolase family 97 N-terminal domain-containing protein [Sphingobacterium sp. E70]ULT24922.1 glycoside hydrolase family 97 N-terminal domain-containing protein [Sphingobacterium sp. E70]
MTKEGTPTYGLKFKNKVVIKTSNLGLELKLKPDEELHLKGQTDSEIQLKTGVRFIAILKYPIQRPALSMKHGNRYGEKPKM